MYVGVKPESGFNGAVSGRQSITNEGAIIDAELSFGELTWCGKTLFPSIVNKRETRSSWYQCIATIHPILDLDFIIDFCCNRNCQVIFSLGLDCFSRVCFGFLDAMYHINCYVIVFDRLNKRILRRKKYLDCKIPFLYKINHLNKEMKTNSKSFLIGIIWKILYLSFGIWEIRFFFSFWKLNFITCNKMFLSLFQLVIFIIILLLQEVYN